MCVWECAPFVWVVPLIQKNIFPILWKIVLEIIAFFRHPLLTLLKAQKSNQIQLNINQMSEKKRGKRQLS